MAAITGVVRGTKVSGNNLKHRQEVDVAYEARLRRAEQGSDTLGRPLAGGDVHRRRPWDPPGSDRLPDLEPDEDARDPAQLVDTLHDAELVVRNARTVGSTQAPLRV